MKVSLITGINGFVGKHLGSFLKKNGHTVYGTSRDITEEETRDYYDRLFQVSFDNKVDIKQLIVQTKPDYIFHLLAQSSVPISWKDPDYTYETNVTKTLNLFDAVKELNLSVRVINIGSSEEYGYDKAWSMPIRENYPLNPLNPYGKSKAAVSQLVQEYNSNFDSDIIHMRPFNHIGPGQRPGFVVPDFASQIVQIEKGMKSNVLKVGNLDSKRDFSDVRDIVKAYLLAAEKGRSGEVYNVCSGIPVRINDILQKLIALSTARINIEVDEKLFRPIDIPEYYGSNIKLVEDTAWNPEWTIDKTLIDIMNYFRGTI